MVAHAPDQDAGAIKKLAFMAGTWQCVVQGGISNGVVDHVSYEFSPDWSWMVERSNVQENEVSHWSAQLSGYDARQKRLVAYQFTSNGVATNTDECSADYECRSEFQSLRYRVQASVTTVEGGTANDGTVFSFTTSGGEQVMHAFSGSDGANPLGYMIDVQGTLYGTTQNGGFNSACYGKGCGIVFALTP